MRILLICFLIAFVRENAAEDLSAIAVFSISGVSGSVSFHQNSSSYSTLITLSIAGIEDGTNATWTICRSWLPLSPQSCQNGRLCETFDPTGRLAAENYTSVCNSGNTTGCALGDLSGRHGLLEGDLQALNFTDNELTLFTSDSVIGRALVIGLPNGVRACANIDVPTSPVSAVTPFRDSSNDVIGNIWFVEYLLPSPFTVIYTDVFANIVTPDWTWFVGQNLVSSGDCSSVGSVYDPSRPGSLSICSTSNQLDCPVGNLTEKNGPLLFKSNVSLSLFHDFNLPVAKDSDGNSVVNRSLSLTTSDTTSPSCGDILSLSPRVATAIFNAEGVMGAITFTQATPFHPTQVKVELQGLNEKASGYHIHVLPTGPSQTDCEVTGGHFNPGNARSVPADATRDLYEVGDLSGKFGTLLSMDNISSSFSDMYIPLFGSNSVIGRSIVIHYPNGLRWICANLTHSQPTTNLVVNLNNSGVVGQVVFTQLQGDPLSETVVFVNFKDFLPIVLPSSSSLGQTSTIGASSTAEESTIAMPTTTSNMADQTEVVITTRSLEATPSFTQTMTSFFTTLPSYSSSSITSETMVTSSSPLERSSSGILGSSAAAVQPSEQSSVTVLSVTEIRTVSTSTSDNQVVSETSLTSSLVEVLSSLSSSAAPTQSVSGSRPTSSATLSPSSAEDTPTPTTSTLSSVDNMPTVTTSSRSTVDGTSSLVLSTSTSSLVANTLASTVSSQSTADGTPSPVMDTPSSVMDTPTPTSTAEATTVLLGTSTRTAEDVSTGTSVETTAGSMSSLSDQPFSNSAFSTGSLSPTPSPGRRRRSAFSSSNHDEVIRNRRQVPSQQPVFWSIRSSCDALPLTPRSGCSPQQPLACQPGDLNSKHGKLMSGKSQVFTDLYLPLSGDGSIEGSMLVLEFGSEMSVCASVEMLVERQTTPTPQPSPSPSPSSSPSLPPPTPTGPSPISPSTVIGIVIAMAVGIVVLIVLIIAIVVFCYCRGKRSGKFNISHLSGENGSVELSSLKYTPAASPISRYAQQYRVIEDHAPADDTELHLVVGDLVRVTEMSEVSFPDKGTEGEMWKGVVGEREGWFPPSKVEPVPLEELNLSNEERMQTMKQRNIDLAAAVIISASKSFSTNTTTVKKPGPREGSKEKKVNRDEKIPRSKSLGAVKGVKVRTRDSPAPTDTKKSNDPGRKRVSTSSLPWITVHNVTKDQIDSTPVSLKKLGQAGNHNSYVSDDVNVILADVPSSSPVVPPTSADELESGCPSPLPPVFSKTSSRGSKGDKEDEVLSKPPTYGYRALFAFTGQTEDDLAFDEGDIIHVTWAEDSGWWYGSVNGQEGWFPGGFVEPLEDNLSYSEGDWSPRSLESPSFEFHNFEDDRPKSVISTDVVKPPEGDLNEDDVVVKMVGNGEKRSVEEKTQDDTLNTTGDFTSEIMGLLAAKTAEKTVPSETQQREKPSAAEGSPDSKPRVNASVGQKSPKAKSSPRIEHQGGALEDPSTSKVEVENSVKETPADTQKEPHPKKRRKPPPPPVKGDVNKQQTAEPVKQNEPESLVPTREDEIKSEALEEPKEKASPKKARRRAPTAPSGKVKLVKVKDEPTTRSNVRRPAPRPPQGKAKQPTKSSPDKLRRNRPIPPPPSIPCPPPPVTSRENHPNPPVNPPLNPPVNPPVNPPARNDSPLALHVNKQGPVKPSPIPAQRRKIEIIHLTSGVDSTPPSDSSKMQQAGVAQLNQNTPTKNVESTAKVEEKPSHVPQESSALTLDVAASTDGQAQDRTKEVNVMSVQVAERVDPSSEVKQNVTTPPAKSEKPATKPKPALKPKPKISITKARKPEKESLHQSHPVTHDDKTTPEGTSEAGVNETKSSPKPVPRPCPPPRGSSLSSVAVTGVEKSPTSDTQTTPHDEANNVDSSGMENTHRGDEGVHDDNTKTTDLQSETKPLESTSIDSPSQPAVAQVPDSKTQEKSSKSSPPAKPSPPKAKPKIVLKSPARVPPAPPTASRQKNIVSVPQKVKVVRPVRSPVLGKAVEPTKQSTPTADVSSTPGSVDLKGKPPRPPPPRTQNVPNTSTFFPTPVPRSKVTDPASSSEQEPPSANLRRVISPYVARESDQLTLSLGDSVSEIKPANKAGFCYGMLDNGQTGLYPSDCVEIW